MRTASLMILFHAMLSSSRINTFYHFLFDVSYLYSTSGRKVELYTDFLNTEEVRKPPTIVIVPRNKSTQNFLVDVRYVDFTSTLDIPIEYSNDDCYIVPPYKPIVYVGLQADMDSFVDIYALRGRN